MTTNTLNRVLTLLFLTVFSACNNNQQNNTQVDTTNMHDTATGVANEKVVDTDILMADKNALPNDEFRRKVIPKITSEKDLKKFDTLLIALDKKGITFCQFLQRLYQLDDSCYAVAKQKFPDPSQQEDFMKVHDKAIDIAQTKYLKYLKLKIEYVAFASFAHGFNQDIKNLCGSY